MSNKEMCDKLVAKLEADLKELMEDPSGLTKNELKRELKLMRKSIDFWKSLGEMCEGKA